MSTHHNAGTDTPVNTAAAKVAVAWALVGVPLAYGVYETLTRVTALFG